MLLADHFKCHLLPLSLLPCCLGFDRPLPQASPCAPTPSVLSWPFVPLSAQEEWETPEEAEEYAYKPPKPAGGGVDLSSLNQKDPKARFSPARGGEREREGCAQAGVVVQPLLAAPCVPQSPLEQSPLGQSPLEGALDGRQAVKAALEDSQVSSGPTMMFATVDYPDCCDRPRTEKLTQQWTGLLSSGGMEVQGYVVKDDTVLFSTNAGLHAKEIKEFVLKQEEVVAVEWNQQRTPGPAETAVWKARDAAKKAQLEAERKATEAATAQKNGKSKGKKGKRKGKAKRKEKDEV